MKAKLLELAQKDGLLFQKLFLLVGTILGVLAGLIISERADRFEMEVDDEIPSAN
jgi:hypothetical protein